MCPAGPCSSSNRKNTGAGVRVGEGMEVGGGGGGEYQALAVQGGKDGSSQRSAVLLGVYHWRNLLESTLKTLKDKGTAIPPLGNLGFFRVQCG